MKNPLLGGAKTKKINYSIAMQLPGNNRTKYALLLPLLVLGLGGLMAQKYDFNRPSLLIRAEDGLPNHYFRGLVMDAYGFIWAGSYDGLARFDGTQIKTFFHQADDSTSLAHSAIASLSVSRKDGKVWVGTYGGLSVFDPVSGKFRSYFHTASDSTSLHTNFIEWVYVDRQDDTWVASGSQILTRFEPETDAFVHYHPQPPEAGLNLQSPKERILAISQGVENDSLLWISTNLRFFSFNKYSRQFNYEHPQWQELEQIFSHSDGYLYLLGKAGNITVYDPGTNQSIQELHPSEGWNIHKILRKSDQALWLSCNKGIAELDTRDFSFSYPWINDIRNKKNYEIDFVESQGRLWSASAAGLQVFDPLTTQFRNYVYETSGAIHPYITQKVIESPNHHFLYLNVNGGEGIYRFGLESQEWLLISRPKDYGAPLFYGKDLTFLKNGQLLILESSEIFTLSQDGRSMVTHPISSILPEERNWLNFFVDSQGYLWLGGAHTGVFRIDPGKGTIESLNEWFPACEQVRLRYAFYQDSRQNVWISNCTGFGVYSYERDTFLLFPYSENGRNDNTFKNIKDFVEGQDGLLWVSNEEDGELGRIKVDHPEQGLYEKFSLRAQVKNGRIHIDKGDKQDLSGITKLTIDANNNLWGISPIGLIKLKPDLSALEVYNEQDGLLWKDEELKVVTANQMERLSSGELVVGFRKGLSIFDPLQLQSSRERPLPYLTSFKVYNNEWAPDSSLFYTRSISLGYEQNYFSFEFSAIGYTHPEKYQYQYKLEGVDQDWVNAGQRNYAAYTNVDGGHYTFLVKVANSDGLWNEEAAKIRLVVVTPWWRQLWFQGSLLLLVLAGVYFFYRYRLNQVRKTERLKAELDKKVANLELTALRAQMNPHFLFNCLNSIDHYIIKNETRKASEYLNSFSRLIRLILQNSRSNYVNLKDELETLTLYMEMESLRFNHRFDFEVQTEPGLALSEIEIPPMLIQPFIENAIWHGLMHKTGKGKVTLSVSKDKGFLKCTIQDDGIGRKKAVELKKRSTSGKKSMGMNITQDRIQTINKIYETNTSVNVIDMTDENGMATGTKVELSIPL